MSKIKNKKNRSIRNYIIKDLDKPEAKSKKKNTLDQRWHG